jgi:hypothetical protein
MTDKSDTTMTEPSDAIELPSGTEIEIEDGYAYVAQNGNTQANRVRFTADDLRALHEVIEDVV